MRLARALGIILAADDVDATKKLSGYDIDSLMGVELRNWLAKDLATNVAVFDIIGGVLIAAIGNLVVANSDIKLCLRRYA